MKTLLLDLDGTLTDPQLGIVGSLRHALTQLGRESPPDAELARCIGPPLADTFERLLEVPPDDPRITQGIGHYRERFEVVGWRENVVLPGIPEFLEAAGARGYRRVVATSKPTVFARRIAAHFGFAIQLEGIYGAELDGRRTAKRDVIAHALAAQGVPAEQAVMVGDRRHDVEGAAHHGIPTVGVTFGFGTRQELEDAGAAWICDAPHEILNCLAATPRGR
jgi:phosphoglycolate phosphatase